MATYTIFTTAADGYIQSSSSSSHPTQATWDKANQGDGDITVSDTDSVWSCGVRRGLDGTWHMYDNLHLFDTSVIDLGEGEEIDSATISVYPTFMRSGADEFRAYLSQWGPTVDTSDWLAVSNLGTSTRPLLGSVPVSTMAVDTYADIDVAATELDHIDPAGTTEVRIVSSDRWDTGFPENHNQTLNMAFAEHSSGGPKLVVRTQTPGSVEFFPSGTGRTGSEESWTVPETGTYALTLNGAEGGPNHDGSHLGGRGADLYAEVDLTAGDVIRVLVAHMGEEAATSFRGGGGGGATYVYNETTGTLLAVAGGGGGAGQFDATRLDASLGTAGVDGQGSPDAGDGGTGGSGGGVGTQNTGGGGTGWLSDGADSYGKGGHQWVPGTAGTGYGGEPGDSPGAGGYGGGGGGGQSGGGGGGYSGGGAGAYPSPSRTAGGGGGSYTDAGAANVSGTTDATGHGGVTLTLMAPPSTPVSISVPTATASADAPAPTVTASASVSLAVPTATANADALAPVVSLPTSISAPTATAQADALAPSADTGSAQVVVGAPGTAEGALPPPSVSTATGVILSVPVATVSADALAPSTTSVQHVSLAVLVATAQADARAPRVRLEVPSPDASTRTSRMGGSTHRSSTSDSTVTSALSATVVASQ